MAVLIFIAAGCSSEKNKIPITTNSEEARQLFLEGRDFTQRILFRDAYERFDEATTKDPQFALAYIYKAITAETPKLVYENIDKAVSLSDNVSEGERLLILAVEANNSSNPAKQMEHMNKLVELYPDDELAHIWIASYYLEQQEYELVVEEATKAKDIRSDCSPAYNLLGYGYRNLGDYEKAEKAFQKYIELIPDDPNPYDSYGELLMKMGKYGESIESYYKALQLDETFYASHLGIASNLNYLNKHQDARDQLQEMLDAAENDGQRLTALYAMAVSFVDEGKLEEAQQIIDRRFAMSEKLNDTLAMAGDLNIKAAIYYEMGKAEKSRSFYDQALELILSTGVSDDVKNNARRFRLYHESRLALLGHDIDKAREHAAEYRKQTEEINHTAQIRAAHRLAGLIALEDENYDMAIAEFRQTSQQIPYNLYYLARAYLGKGDTEKAREWMQKAAEYNILSNLQYAFIRQKAKMLLEELNQQQ